MSPRTGEIGTGKKVVWIDIDNSPHVPFFLPIIAELQSRGIELVLTARDTYQVCDLIDYFSLPCKVIGRHYGKNKLLKVLGNCLRAAELLPVAIAERADLAISHGSRAQVLVCKSLGIPTLVMHDYEHSTKTGFIESDWILMPDVIPNGAMSKKTERVLKYEGLKEDVYIPQFQPDASILDQLGLDARDLIVTLRPPATEAHYHNPQSDVLFTETLHVLANESHLRVVVLPRSVRQNQQIQKEWAALISSGQVVIPRQAVNGLNLIWFSDLVISGGGTMNREAAALGVPVYSIFRGKIGAVDKYLSDNGRLVLIENVQDVKTKIRLTRRKRPEQPNNGRGAVLQNIVNNVISILENGQPAPICIERKEPKIAANGQHQLVTESRPKPAAVWEGARDAHNDARGIVHRFDPLDDSRWDALVSKHPRASLFHSSPWLKALNRTYGYPVVGYTTSAPGAELENAMVFCRVESWVTGRRLVSLPFSDHCEPLIDRQEDLQALAASLEEETRREKWRYVEVRPLKPIEIVTSLHSATLCYNFFELDLRPDLETIFRSLHKDSIQRKIRRAQREKLSYEEGNDDSLLDDFYRLLMMTRRRHRLPPQPRKWFENLVNCFGDALKIRIARKDGRAVAAMLTISHKDTLVYKYGASDSRYHNLGSMHLLYWTSIQEARASGLRFFDLGRTDADQTGLITFKKRWGAKESLLKYSRYSLSKDSSHMFDVSTSKQERSVAREVLSHLPDGLTSLLGRALYKHVG
jgi:predicted glycosyltransferase/CelD/BcsL family acetyltransferase involved in cellulose biosynthesis